MPTIEVSDETYEKIKDQLAVNEKVDIQAFDEMIGKKWFFRTVTYHLVGRVKRHIGTFFLLEGASWIPDSGRFMQFIKEGKLNEVEPVGDMLVNLNAVTDVFPWVHPLPKKQQ